MQHDMCNTVAGAALASGLPANPNCGNCGCGCLARQAAGNLLKGLARINGKLGGGLDLGVGVRRVHIRRLP